MDNPGDLPVSARAAQLRAYRSQLLNALEGVPPTHAVLRAFSDTLHETGIPIEEALLFLDAMEADLHTSRYPDYAALYGYMRGSACAVGLMMLRVLEVSVDEETERGAMALGEAMQLTNFLRDVGEDARRGRIYLPLEDLRTFGVSEEEILEHRLTDRFVALLRMEIERARGIYRKADPAIERLPRPVRRAVKLARLMYAAILDRIEENGYDVFTRRARTTRWQKARTLAAALLGRV